MLDKRMFHQDVLKQIRVDTYDMVSAPRTMLEEAQRLADSNGKTYFVGAKYEPNPDFKEPESLRGVLDPNPMCGRRTRLSGEFCISDSREEVFQGGFGSLIWVNPSKYDRKGVPENPMRTNRWKDNQWKVTKGKQWKVTIIMDEDSLAFTADSVLRVARVDLIGHKVRNLLRDPLFEISDVVDAEEYKPINRSPEDAA